MIGSSATPNVDDTLGTAETIDSGVLTTPVTIPTIAVITIVKKIPPLTFFVKKMTAKKIPKIANRTLPCERSPNVIKVDSLATIIPAPFKPTNVMNKPIPADTAYFNCCGIALIIVSRIPVNDKRIKITPEKNTPVKPVCHGIPYVHTTV